LSDLSFLLNHDHDHHHQSGSTHDEPSEEEKGDHHCHSSHDHHSSGAHTTTDGALHAAVKTDVPTSAYVHSTFDISKVLLGLTLDDQNNTSNSINCCLEKKLLNGEIRNIIVDVSEQTLSVHHRPYFLTASGIVDALDSYLYEVSIKLDGGADGGSSHDGDIEEEKGDQHCHSSHDRYHHSDSVHAEPSSEATGSHLNHSSHDHEHGSGDSHEHSSYSDQSHHSHEHNHSHSKAEESNEHLIEE
jgi:hypothetical protein